MLRTTLILAALAAVPSVAAAQENTAALCQDGRDNDANGRLDCADPGCAAFVFCASGGAATTSSADDASFGPVHFTFSLGGVAGAAYGGGGQLGLDFGDGVHFGHVAVEGQGGLDYDGVGGAAAVGFDVGYRVLIDIGAVHPMFGIAFAYRHLWQGTTGNYNPSGFNQFHVLGVAPTVGLVFGRQHLFGFQVRGWLGEGLHHNRIENMARADHGGFKGSGAVEFVAVL